MARRGRGKPIVYPNPAYVRWQNQAALEWLLQKPRRFKTLEIPLKATLVLCPPPRLRRRRFDVDNRLKATFDFLQKSLILKNDCQIVECTVRKGTEEEAPSGARIILERVGDVRTSGIPRP